MKELDDVKCEWDMNVEEGEAKQLATNFYDVGSISSDLL